MLIKSAHIALINTTLNHCWSTLYLTKTNVEVSGLDKIIHQKRSFFVHRMVPHKEKVFIS